LRKLRTWSTRERVVLGVIIAELVLLLVSGLVNFAPQIKDAREARYLRKTAGEAVVIDGVLQNDRIRFEDVYYEDGKIYYTLVNESSQQVISERFPPWIERKEGDAWRLCMDVNKLSPMKFDSVGAFSREARVLDAGDVWDEVLPGEYRIVSGAELFSHNGGAGNIEWYLQYPEDKSCIVGYFTITEEMLNVR